MLIVTSVVGLLLISIVILIPIGVDQETKKLVFNALVPLFGTWVGTVIAYYFSRENFATAAGTMTQLASASAGLTGTLCTAAMIEKAKIGGLATIPAGKGPADLNLKTDFLDKLTPIITRIPVVDSTDAIRYVVHDEVLHKFVFKKSTVPPAGGFDVATATLADVLADQELSQLVTAFATLSISATLADAKQQMDAKPHSTDVFVTPDGTPTKPILGWITDNIIASYARV